MGSRCSRLPRLLEKTHERLVSDQCGGRDGGNTTKNAVLAVDRKISYLRILVDIVAEPEVQVRVHNAGEQNPAVEAYLAVTIAQRIVRTHSRN